MGAVAVSRLALSTPPGRRAEAQARSEDALRLAGGGDDRLLIVRKLDLGALPVGARPSIWQARAEGGLKELSARAIHGAHPDAAASDAVWFRSADEARAVLLLMLARGVLPHGWFWKLAVRDWRGASLTVWLPRWVASARHDPASFVALAKAVIEAVSQGHGRAVLMAIAALRDLHDLSRARLIGEEQPKAYAPDAPTPMVMKARLSLSRLSSIQQSAIAECLAHVAAPVEARRWLARVALVSAAPDMLAREADLGEMADALLAEAVTAPEGSAHPPARAPRPDVEAASALSRASEIPSERTSDLLHAEARAVPAEPDHITPNAESLVPDSKPEPPSLAADRSFPEVAMASDMAGLWLVIPALNRMGLSEWAEAWSIGFGSALLRHIAARHRLLDEDAALAPLIARETELGWAGDAWRVGLDRWLRRRARLRLCDVIHRPGRLRLVEDRLTVRFHPDHADIRLRRPALDLDPGWVPWLGLAVRYEYRDGSVP